LKALLSVVIPTYNGEKYIAAALESVLRQEHLEEIELVVVDDGSTDQTLDIVRGVSEALPIRLITPGRIGNWVAATNIGLRAAAGEWACILHQDDLWLAGRLARIWPEMATANGALIVHNARYIGPSGEELGPWSCPFEDGMIPPGRFIERLLIQNFLAMPSPVFRRNAVIQSGGMDEALWFSTDWDLWLRLAALGPVRFIAETLAAFRVHPASQTAARKLLPNEWEQQLTTVLFRHLEVWPVTGKTRAAVEGVGLASIAVNSALSAASRGESVKALPVLLQLLALGPSGWHRYLRDSRIVQRVRSRLKAQRLERL
jgi:glycosyltransferase involved in cell wall biosynthesis